MRHTGLCAALLTTLLVFPGCRVEVRSSGPVALERAEAGTTGAERSATVERGVDGDTIVVTGGERVRLIGIDTPETVDPRRAVGCFGKEASRRTGDLLPPGTAVRLVYDVDRQDRFGRTLAYVYRATDGLFVNAALVEEGYAQPATFPPNVAHADEFGELAARARERGSGMWGTCPD